MQKLLSQLSREEAEEFNRLKFTQNGVEEKTFEICLHYYLQYRNHAHISPDKLQLYFKAALLMAEKSNTIQNVKGQKITLPSLTLGQLLKNHPLDEVMITLKDLSKHVKIHDGGSDLANLIKEISFLITFHKKFQKIIQKLELKERQPQGKDDYHKNWVSFAWLLYIQAKNNVLMRSLDLIENTCMLAHTIAFMLTFGWDYIVPKAVIRLDKRINQHSSLRQAIPILRDKVLEMFSIKTIQIYAANAASFQQYFEQQLEAKGIIKSSPNQTDFLSPELMNQNYRKLDRFYQKSMSGNDLDQRIFFKERMANLTPSKFTPFARQGYANKGRKVTNNQAQRDNYSSHRILNYEMMDKFENVTKPQGITLGQLPKAVLASPASNIKVPLICSTPITTGMEMYNYVSQKSRKFKQLLSEGKITKRPHQASLVKQIQLLNDKAKKELDKKTKEVRQGLIYSNFKLALQDYLMNHEADKENQQIFRGFMAMSIQIVLFVNNSAITFEDIQKQLKTSTFEVWKACDFFINYDRSMPLALRTHLLDIQVGLISEKMWRQQTNVGMLSHFIEQQDNSNQFVQKLFRRILLQTGFQINQLGQKLQLQEFILQNIYATLKYIICEDISMLHGRHLDQLIMCAIFANCRKQKIGIKFQEIVDVYQQVNPYNQDIHDELIYKILSHKGQIINLVTYYNDCFIINVKKFILNLKVIVNQQKKQYNGNLILQSPLREILPRQMNRKHPRKNGKEGNTNLLIAYTDSPLLQHKPIKFKAAPPQQSHKMIDFEQEQEQLFRRALQQDKFKETQKYAPMHEPIIPPQISKKFSNNNWKPAQKQRLTPTRIPKNTSHPSQLSQFTTNPTPPLNIKQSNKIQSLLGGFSKGRVNLT